MIKHIALFTLVLTVVQCQLMRRTRMKAPSCDVRDDIHSPFYWKGQENICTDQMCRDYPELNCNMAPDYLFDQAAAHFPEDIYAEIGFLQRYFNQTVPTPDNSLPYSCQGVCMSKPKPLKRMFTDLTLSDPNTYKPVTKRYLCHVIGPHYQMQECGGPCSLTDGGNERCVPDVTVSVDVWVYCPGATPGCHKRRVEIPLSCSCKRFTCMKKLPPITPFTPRLPDPVSEAVDPFGIGLPAGAGLPGGNGLPFDAGMGDFFDQGMMMDPSMISGGMGVDPSLPLGSPHGQLSGGMGVDPSLPLGSPHGQLSGGMGVDPSLPLGSPHGGLAGNGLPSAAGGLPKHAIDIMAGSHVPINSIGGVPKSALHPAQPINSIGGVPKSAFHPLPSNPLVPGIGSVPGLHPAEFMDSGVSVNSITQTGALEPVNKVIDNGGVFADTGLTHNQAKTMSGVVNPALNNIHHGAVQGHHIPLAALPLTAGAGAHAAGLAQAQHGAALPMKQKKPTVISEKGKAYSSALRAGMSFNVKVPFNPTQ